MERQTNRAHVAKLEVINSAPNADRVQLIRNWHADQAQSDREPVALLSLAITGCGKVHTAGLAIEPEHALILLGELETVTLTLRSYIEARLAALPGNAEVMRFNRRA